jgi:hypothetical protein
LDAILKIKILQRLKYYKALSQRLYNYKQYYVSCKNYFNLHFINYHKLAYSFLHSGDLEVGTEFEMAEPNLRLQNRISDCRTEFEIAEPNLRIGREFYSVVLNYGLSF